MSPILTRSATVISNLFSPLLIPTWSMMTAMWITSMHSAPEQIRIKSALVVLAVTCIIPTILILWLLKHGVIMDMGVNRRRDRFLPLGVVVLCYGFCAWFLRYTSAPMWTTHFFLGACICACLALALSIKWKVSIHGMAIGGFVAMMFFIAFTGRSELFMLPWLVVSVFIAGLVATARLILGAHTPLQVYTGIAIGLVVIGSMLYFAPMASFFRMGRLISVI